jgi:hypothetical protein
MVSRGEAADRAHQRPMTIMTTATTKKLVSGRPQTAPGHRAGEQFLLAPRRPQFLRVPGAWQQPGRRHASEGGEQCPWP